MQIFNEQSALKLSMYKILLDILRKYSKKLQLQYLTEELNNIKVHYDVNNTDISELAVLLINERLNINSDRNYQAIWLGQVDSVINQKNVAQVE